MEIDPATLPHTSIYKLMTGSIVPRPIGWISTVDDSGRPNLAPFSFFNAVCSNPPTVLFCSSIRGSDGKTKDTLNNVRTTGEFVVNIVSEDLFEAMNASSIEAPADFNEFDYAGVSLAASHKVRPPRVAQSPVHFECTLREIIEIGSEPGGGSVVIGTIVHIHAEDRVLIGTDKINIQELKPIGRLMGNGYCRVTDVIEIARPKNILGG